MTSDYTIVPIKLCLDVGNDEYILCTFGRRIMSGFEVKQGDRQIKQPPKTSTKGQEKQKKALSIG